MTKGDVSHPTVTLERTLGLRKLILLIIATDWLGNLPRAGRRAASSAGRRRASHAGLALFPESATQFFPITTAVEISFVKDEKGQETHLILKQGGQDIRARKIN